MNRVICVPNLTPFIADESECIQFLFDEGFHTKMRCRQCNALLSPRVYKNKTFPLFKCERGHNRIKVSCAKGTWFENTKIPPAQVLLLTHCFAHKYSYAQTALNYVLFCTIMCIIFTSLCKNFVKLT